jgi:hypothetical protein
MDNPQIGTKVRVNHLFPYEGEGLIGTIVDGPIDGSARRSGAILVKLDEGQQTDIKTVVTWHRSYFDSIDPEPVGIGRVSGRCGAMTKSGIQCSMGVAAEGLCVQHLRIKHRPKQRHHGQ